MRFIINTTYVAAGTVVLEGIAQRLVAGGHEVARNEWENYHRYDVVLFMAPDSKVVEAKRSNPNLLCGIFDPKVTHHWQKEEVQSADFLVVSSIEQREFFLRYNKQIFIYYMFPDIEAVTKSHTQKEKIIIGYHGNKQHLDAMADASRALDELAQVHNIELWAIYNIKKLGRWKRNVPKRCPVKHIQWSENALVENLRECDIGIVPSVLPVGSLGRILARPLRSLVRFFNPEGYNRKDYLLRFKPSNNPGRIYVCAQLHIPVVADFTPSACEFIKDETSGYLVGTTRGWYRALEQLIESHERRVMISKNLSQNITLNYTIDTTFAHFIHFLHSIR